MITKLSIKNFQSHKETELDFHPGMNVIIGQSDSGKTAIIRALRKALTNKPAGDTFRSNWGGDTQIKLLTKEGDEITYFKSNSTSSYHLNDLEFKAFGQEVPEEIERVLNIDEVNIQHQLDAPYLLSQTPGVVAQHFNKIAKLGRISQCLKTIESWYRAMVNELGAVKTGLKPATGVYAQIEIVDTKLSSLPDLQIMEREVEKIEYLENQWEQQNVKAKALKMISVQYHSLLQEIDTQIHLLGLENLLDNILNLYQEKTLLQQKYNSIRQKGVELHNLQKTLKRVDSLAVLLEPVDTLLNLIELRKSTGQILNEINKVFNCITENNERQIHLINQISALQKEFDENMPEICPLCNSKLS